MRRIAILLLIHLTLAGNLATYAQGSGGTQQPATITELSQRGVSLKPDIFAPLRGVFTNTTSLLRDKDVAAVLDNLQMTTRGIWTSRGIGYKKWNTASYAGQIIREFGQHTDSSGTSHLLVHAATFLYDANTTTGAKTQIYSGMTNTAGVYPCFASFSPTQLIFTTGGLTAPGLWDGNPANAATLFTGWPVTVAGTSYNGPKYLEVFAGRMIYAGFDAQPMNVLFSKQGDPKSFTISAPAAATDGGAFTLPSVLGEITGMRTLRTSDSTSPEVLLIGCERGMAMITGNSGTNFALYTLTKEFGLLSNRSWAQLQNDLYFMATDGIRKYTSLISNASLLNSSLTFPIQDLINRQVQTVTSYTNGSVTGTIKRPIYNQVFAVHHPSTQEVLWWLPVDSDTSYQPAHAIVMNYNTQTSASSNAFAIDPIWSTRSGVTLSCGINFAGEFYSGNTSGELFQHYAADDYAGSPIAWTYMSPLIPTNSPSQNASMRKFVVITDGPNQQFTATAYTANTLTDGSTEFKQRDSRSYSVTASSITNLGTWATGTTNSYPHLIDCSSSGSGRYWALRLSGSSANDHISLVGIQTIQTVGGWKQ